MSSPSAGRRRSLINRAACIAAVAALAAPATAAAAPATNGIYSVDVAASGNFTAITDSGHPAGAGQRLTYPNGGRWLLHSYSSGTDYALADGGTPGSVSDIANGKRFQYGPLASDSLDVRQDVTVSGTSVSDSVVRIALRVENTGATPVKIGTRAAVDFMLAGDDGPVFTPQGGAPLTAAQRYVDPTFATFTLEDNDMGSATLRGLWTVASTGLGTTAPDVLEMADCCVGANGPLLPALPLSSFAIEWDNEVRWIWGQDETNGRTLAPGESTSFVIASALSDAAGSGPPVNTVVPAIGGDPTEGQTLTGTSGTWTSGPMTSYTYQWRRCDADGTNCADVAGAADAQYTLTAADVGSTMRLRVTADGTVSADSAPTAVVTAPDNVAPETVIDGGPSGSVTQDSATFQFSSEAGAQFECSLDGGSWSACTSPHALTGLSKGAHTFQVRASDAALNVDASPASRTWTIVAPAPDPEPETTPPVTPEPETTPPVAPEPKAPPKLITTVTTGTTPSGATAVEVDDNAVDVGCRMTGVELASCRVELYVAARARTAAARRVLVGSGIVEADGRTNRLAVRIELNALGRKLMRRSPAGVEVRVAITGRPTTGTPLKATSTVRLVPRSARLRLGGYRPDQSRLPARSRRALRKLANSLAPGARIKVVGHTDSSSRDDRYLRRLGRARANAVVRYLRSRGVEATYVVRSKAATRPRATNATAAGRARNRRVALTIVR